MTEIQDNCAEGSVSEPADLTNGPHWDDITPDHDGGVLKQIVRAGNGDDHPLKYDTVYVHYVGKLTDGTQFDSSRGKKKFQFVVGHGSVIKAWDLAITTMKQGELALFQCKPKYAYGKKGSPPKVPPNATLLFEIELFSWRGEDVSENKDGSLLKSYIAEGEGRNPPKDGAICEVHVIGKHGGRKFVDRDFKFTLGEGSEVGIVEGIEQCLKTFKSGERSLLKIKARHAYGAEGHAEYNIPPNTDLDFDVHLKSYEPFKEGWMMDDIREKLSEAELMKRKGTQFFQAGKFKFAARYYTRIIEFLKEEDTLRGRKREQRDSLMLAGYLNIAACQLKLGNNLDAAHACDDALGMDPRSEKALYRRATAYVNMSNYETALDDYKALVDINPNNKLARDQMTLISNKIKDIHQREKTMYTKMFQKKPETEILKLWKVEKTENSDNTGATSNTETSDDVSNDDVNEDTSRSEVEVSAADAAAGEMPSS